MPGPVGSSDIRLFAAIWLLCLSALPQLRAQVCEPTQYAVQPGDFLCNITNNYDVSADAILTANRAYPGGILINATKDHLKSDITLDLPCPSTPCCPSWTYAARSGDSFFSISQQFGIDFDTLRLANNIDISDPECCPIFCSDAITIPCSGEEPTCATEEAQPLPAPLSGPAILPPPADPILPPPLPLPVVPDVAPISPFAPITYKLWLPSFTADEISSPRTDSDYVNVFCRINGIDSSTSPLLSRELKMHSGSTQIRYPSCEAIATSPDDIVTMGFQIVNAGDNANLGKIIQDSTAFIDAALTATGEILWVPLVTAASSIVQDLTPNCDGLVAADAVIFTPSNYTDFITTTTGSFQRSYNTTHCDQLSAYSVQWEVFIPRDGH